MLCKIDLHTHSGLSFDGGLTLIDYTKILQQNVLDVVAVTDHNTITFAKELQKKFGRKIIVGEEIESLDGEIIGLFLQKEIPPKLSAFETIQRIKMQNGLVYIPHPFEIQRKSIKIKMFEKIKKEVDIVEVFNGRSMFRGKELKDKEILQFKNFFTASSDAHCFLGVGKTYTGISGVPTRQTLLKALKKGVLVKNYPPLISYLCPFINKIKKRAHL